ncbi:hypothetical protein M569_08730 [Genlisea aurea]|uniref:DUF1677 family protein n=1 Tax=Genlisea aurea TaxID=192259 RepID=S8CMN3_9LAMI|nr:hypothetical protein M569_08730 [Genlisea aurea]
MEGDHIVQQVKCDCCGLIEDCTQAYITQVRSNFRGKWLCGLCSQAVADEAAQHIDEALKAHMLFCRRDASDNPALRVAQGIGQMLRRRRK